MKSDTIEPGVIRLKVTKAFAAQLEKRSITQTSDSLVQTGVQALDDLTQLYKVKVLKRVFAPAGKFEAKHRKSGLHQWYEVRMDTTVAVQEAITAFGALPQIEKAEPIFKRNEATKPSF
jgi:hypothetical protein